MRRLYNLLLVNHFLLRSNDRSVLMAGSPGLSNLIVFLSWLCHFMSVEENFCPNLSFGMQKTNLHLPNSYFPALHHFHAKFLTCIFKIPSQWSASWEKNAWTVHI